MRLAPCLAFIVALVLASSMPSHAQVIDDGGVPDGGLVDAGAPDGGLLADDETTADELEAADELAEEPTGCSPDSGFRYTTELSDRELARLWKDSPQALGTISIGRPEEGRLINAIPFPEAPDGGAWKVIVPESCWTTTETADAIIGAATQLREWFPEGAPVRVGQVSGPEGGFLPPHLTHQNGRDIDVGLFYPGPEPYRVIEREKVMDVPMNWGFVKAILMHGDVQHILLDRRVQKVLYDYALKIGEDRKWLERVFHNGNRSIFRHARKHRDHFHVRLLNVRAQELAFRLAPLLPVRTDENVAFHRVKSGDTLGRIAINFHTSVSRLKTANHLASTFLSVGQLLRIPLKGPCTNCPVPRPAVAPPRLVEPEAPTPERPAG